MPYIEQDDRNPILRRDKIPETPGELNFAITTLVDDYTGVAGGGEVSYSGLNEIIGVLECVKLELYRRVAAPYEDQKRQENGDVYFWLEPPTQEKDAP